MSTIARGRRRRASLRGDLWSIALLRPASCFRSGTSGISAASRQTCSRSSWRDARLATSRGESWRAPCRTSRRRGRGGMIATQSWRRWALERNGPARGVGTGRRLQRSSRSEAPRLLAR
eukprot:scaffold46143_cov26-Tisochrysis_lutea.AAC.5